MDVTKKDQVEALAKEHDHVDVLFNVAGYAFPLSCIVTVLNDQNANIDLKIS